MSALPRSARYSGTHWTIAGASFDQPFHLPKTNKLTTWKHHWWRFWAVLPRREQRLTWKVRSSSPSMNFNESKRLSGLTKHQSGSYKHLSINPRNRQTDWNLLLARQSDKWNSVVNLLAETESYCRELERKIRTSKRLRSSTDVEAKPNLRPPFNLSQGRRGVRKSQDSISSSAEEVHKLYIPNQPEVSEKSKNWLKEIIIEKISSSMFKGHQEIQSGLIIRPTRKILPSVSSNEPKSPRASWTMNSPSAACFSCAV